MSTIASIAPTSWKWIFSISVVVNFRFRRAQRFKDPDGAILCRWLMAARANDLADFRQPAMRVIYGCVVSGCVIFSARAE